MLVELYLLKRRGTQSQNLRPLQWCGQSTIFMPTYMSTMLSYSAVLETPNPSGKHARWWSKLFGSCIRKLEIVYHSGKENSNADALSHCPHGEEPAIESNTDVPVSAIQSSDADVDLS